MLKHSLLVGPGENKHHNMDFLYKKLGRRQQEPLKTVSLPDLDNPSQVKKFFTELREALVQEEWPENAEQAIECLLELSERGEGLGEVAQGWVAVVRRAQDTGFLQTVLYITVILAEHNNDSLQSKEFCQVCWEILEGEYTAIAQYSVLRVLQLVHQSLGEFLSDNSNKVNLLVDLLVESSEFVRNGKSHIEALILLKYIAVDTEICKLLGFQGIFESLLEIARSEEGVVRKDCLKLMTVCLSDFNKPLVMEMRNLVEELSELLGTSAGDAAAEFILTACRDSAGRTIAQNTEKFVGLAGGVVGVAFPLSSLDQSVPALELFQLIVEESASVAVGLLHLLIAEREALDAILTYALVGSLSGKTREIVSSLAKNYQLQAALFSKIAYRPGLFPSKPVPLFNSILNSYLEDPTHYSSATKLLENLLWNNEISKELGWNLKIDEESHTLFYKVTASLIANLPPEDYLHEIELVSAARLLLIWVDNSEEGCVRLTDSLNSYIPDILSYVLKEQGYGQAIVASLLGVLCVNSSQPHLFSLIMKHIEYTKYCKTIEFILNRKDFKSKEGSAELLLDAPYMSL